MNTIKTLFTIDTAAIEADSQNVQRSFTRNVASKTIFNSLLSADTAKFDIVLISLLALSDSLSFHASQAVEFCKMINCKRTNFRAHFLANKAKQRDNMQRVIITDNVFSCTAEDQAFFQTIFQMNDFQQQMLAVAAEFYAYLDNALQLVETAHEEAEILNSEYIAHAMNDDFDAASTKAAKKKAIK